MNIFEHTSDKALFFPFAYKTREDRVRLLAALWAFRLNDLPVPVSVGYLVTMYEDKDFDALYKDVISCSKRNGTLSDRHGLLTCVKALEIIGYFHGVNCKDGGTGKKCLGVKVADKIIELTDRIADA